MHCLTYIWCQKKFVRQWKSGICKTKERGGFNLPLFSVYLSHCGFSLVVGEGQIVPPPLFRSDQNCLDILRFHGHCQRCFCSVRKLTCQAKRLDCGLVHLDSIQVVFDFRFKCQTTCRVEAHIIASLVFNVEWVFRPLAPWESSVFGWQCAILAPLLDNLLVVVFHAAPHDDGGDFLDLAFHSLACLHPLAEDGMEVCAFAGGEDVFDFGDVHYRMGFSAPCHLIGWLFSVASFEADMTISWVG